MSNSLQPHESQHARPPCPSPAPGVHSSIVYYYLIGFKGRGISNVDASYACGGIWFQMTYPRDKVCSQNFFSQKHEYHLVDVVHWLLDYFFLRKWNKSRLLLLSCRAGRWWQCLELPSSARKSGISSCCFMTTELVIRHLKCLLYMFAKTWSSQRWKFEGFTNIPWNVNTSYKPYP